MSKKDETKNHKQNSQYSDQTDQNPSSVNEQTEKANVDQFETQHDETENEQNGAHLDYEAQESKEDLLKQIESLQSELDETKAELDKEKERASRAYAEMENAKKRAEKDIANARKYALESFSKELLPVVDSIEKACEVEVDADHVKAIHEGVELTWKLFIDTVKKYGLEQINPQNETFDPNLHEAMSAVNNPDMEPNKVMTVVQKGYKLNDRVIRPARVIVTKK